MSDEKQKAYEEWWSDPASPNNTRDIFNAGWEAGLRHERTAAPPSERELLRAKIKAFNRWWAVSSLGSDQGPAAEQGFSAGWNAHATTTANEREVTEVVARQIERQSLKRKFLALASTAFLAGQDEEAKMYRSIADLHFS